MIESRDNENFKYWLKLKRKKYRDLENKFLIFGPHLIEEAKKHGKIFELITSNPNKEGTLISKSLMKELNFTKTPYEQAAVCKKTIKNIKSNKILMLDDVQDPDNVGALIRSASAFGFEKVIMSTNTADFYNDKVIRASQGSIFHVSHERCNLIDRIKELKDENYKIYVTAVTDESYSFDDKNDKIVLVLGNEGKGVSDNIMQLADKKITIPTKNVESLNVSIAGAILMYEWSKQ